MRCPKCQYITFDGGDRCRNCGYESSLTVAADTFDLPIQTGDEAIGPLADFSLTNVHGRPTPPAREGGAGYTPPNGGFPSRGPVPAPRTPTPVRVPSAAPPDTPAPRRPGTTPLELPLFSNRAPDDDRPLVTPPAVPRAPLSVRRSGPPVPRTPPRTYADEPELDLDPPPRGATTRAGAPGALEAGVVDSAGSHPGAAAGPVARLGAAVFDLLLLASVDAAVLYFTLQLVGFEWIEILLLPRVPLLGFLLLLNGGYFVAFTTAGGQTIGKMLTGIKVVPAADESPSDRVPLGHAAVRTAAFAVSVLPAGLGYVPALVSRDRRALHDRLADTRVVQA